MATSARQNPAGLDARRAADRPIAPTLRQSIWISFLCFAALTVAAAATGQAPTGGLLSRQAVALNPVTSKAYAVETEEDSIAVVDGMTHKVTSVKVGKAPVAIVVNAATNRVYVANHGSGNVSVLDGTSNVLLATVDVGSLPYSMAVDPASNTIYVSNIYSQTMTMIDGATNRTSSMKIGSWDAMLADPQRSRVYLLGYESADITILDVKAREKNRVPMGAMHLWGLALNPSSGNLLVTRVGRADVVSYDVESKESAVIKTGEYPCAVAINSKTNRAYIANYLDDSVTVIDTGRKLALATIAAGARPEAVALDENTDRVYVANSRGNTVTVIDGQTNQVVGTLNAGLNPFAIVVDPRKKVAYVADATGTPFTQVDLSTSPIK